ncbi:TlpA disulfide reductase family protein [Lysinibacillus telephonicus]|uniref:TlpA family protein disulfide reductase n=1 Tax=Lysinibacillus telephonicus TaxID=1714840 RepID=A0A431UNU0_9BACI|nr:TlpA disulfide reductase family protein [Lysinibacillus telephonicus]RTQ91080.1 TlpA family protein disulfide reductase [Lysinibacillus telephonicus]
MIRYLTSIGLSAVLLLAIVWSIISNFHKEENGGEALNEVNQPVIKEKEIHTSVGQVEDNQGDAGSFYVDIDESVLYSHDHEHMEQQPEVSALNIPAPDFELMTLDGKTLKLSDYLGKKILINFWATWCPPCTEEMPILQNYYEQHAEDNNAVILAVNLTDQEGGIEPIRKFANDFHLTMPILLDKKGQVSINYEILTLPTSMIVNEEGFLVEQIIGPVTEEMLEEKLGVK